MIRRPPRSTRVRSSAASDVYKRQEVPYAEGLVCVFVPPKGDAVGHAAVLPLPGGAGAALRVFRDCWVGHAATSLASPFARACTARDSSFDNSVNDVISRSVTVDANSRWSACLTPVFA